MLPISVLAYHESESASFSRQTKLFTEWAAHLEAQAFEKCAAGDLVLDGFLPYYFSQKVRVLFIGRESRGLAGHNYLDVITKCYREDKAVDGFSLNRHKFHRLLLYVAYSLNNGFCDWDDTPWAAQIGDAFATGAGVSFAFMNLSKISNESDSWQMDPKVVAEFVRASRDSRNFIREQVEMLAPDVVVTMNVEEYFDVLGSPEALERVEHVAEAYRMQVGAKSSLLINTFHFSAPGKSDQMYYIDPIRQLAKKYLTDSRLQSDHSV